jgi:hypothetical protein
MVLEILDSTDFWDYVVSMNERWEEQSRMHEHVPVPHTLTHTQDTKENVNNVGEPCELKRLGKTGEKLKVMCLNLYKLQMSKRS